MNFKAISKMMSPFLSHAYKIVPKTAKILDEIVEYFHN